MYSYKAIYLFFVLNSSLIITYFFLKRDKKKEVNVLTEVFEIDTQKMPIYLIKLVLIGDGGVGKTSIRKRYLGEGFEKEHLATLGADFAATTRIIDDTTIKFQIWDLAGQPMFKSVRPRFFRGCFGALAVFDVTRRDTFLNLSNWLDELYNFSGRGIVPVIILANKIDLENKEVSMEEVEDFVSKLNERTSNHEIENFSLETSAKTGKNIDKAFEIIGKYILNRSRTDSDK